MAFKIKVAGAPSATAKPKPAATKRSTARPTAAKPAAKRGPGRPRTTGKASPAAAAASASRRSSVPKTDDKTMTRLLAAVKKAGDRRRKAEAEHKESVDALHEAAQAALDGGVPMSRVSDASGISRQWLYKMGEFAGRGENGNGGNKAAAKAAVKRTTRQGTKSTQSTQSKRASAKPRIKGR